MNVDVVLAFLVGWLFGILTDWLIVRFLYMPGLVDRKITEWLVQTAANPEFQGLSIEAITEARIRQDANKSTS